MGLGTDAEILMTLLASALHKNEFNSNMFEKTSADNIFPFSDGL